MCTAFSNGCCKDLMKGDALAKQEIYVDGLGFLKKDTVVAPDTELNRKIFWCQACKNKACKSGATTQEIAKLLLELKNNYDSFIKRYCRKSSWDDTSLKRRHDVLLNKEDVIETYYKSNRCYYRIKHYDPVQNKTHITTITQEAYQQKINKVAEKLSDIYDKRLKQLVDQLLFHNLGKFQKAFLEYDLNHHSRTEFYSLSEQLKDQFDELVALKLIRIRENTK